MYKDKDKQREAQRNWVQQKRAKEQGSTEGSTGIAGIVEGYPDPVFTSLIAKAKPGLRRVSKPGDADYVPMCETSRRFMEDG